MQTNYLTPDDRMIRMDRLKLIIVFFDKELTIEEQEELDQWVVASEDNMTSYDDILEAAWPLLEHRQG